MTNERANKVGTRPEERSSGGFWALVATQFQGAFNDNAFKMLMTLYLLNVFVDERVHRFMIPVSFGLFTLPFLLFSMYSGALADRNSKKRVIVWAKALEIAIMLCGLGAFMIRDPHFTAVVLFGTLFLMAAQSTLFSPAKYGILPEILPPHRLSWGNGIVQMSTFVAIITGTAIAGVLMDWFGTRVYFVSVFLVMFSVAGLMISFNVSSPPAADPGRSAPLYPWSGLGRYMKLFVADRWLFLTMLGIAYFWFAGVIMQQNIMLFAKNTLELGDTRISLLLAGLAFGIGTGGLSAGYLSAGKIEVGLIPLGALGISLFSVLLAIPGFGFLVVLILLFCLGFSSGFYVIPLTANLQRRSPDYVKGGMIATSNFVNNVGMTVSAAAFFLLASVFKLSPYAVFLITSVLTIAVCAYICGLLPYFLFRFLVWLLTHSMYRIRVDGRDNIPEKGGALFVCNHMSYMDGLLLTGSTDRQVRFVMFKGAYTKPIVHLFAKISGAIPIASGDRRETTDAALQAAREGILSGDVVCVFAEGQITRTGQMLPFRRGFERIMQGVDAPIIPVNLDRIWGSVFSFAEGRFFWKKPKRFRRRITVTFGHPLPPNSPASEVRIAVQELGAHAFARRKPDQPLLHRGFVSVARRYPRRMAVVDAQSSGMSFFKVLTSSITLARNLRPLLGDRNMVGVLMPPSAQSAVCNIALGLMGKVPVNLNYNVHTDMLESVARQCELDRVITLRSFEEQQSMTVPAHPLYIEDVLRDANVQDSTVAWLLARLCPVKWLERLLGAPPNRSQDDLCTVIFTSGSTGESKGVMLSHHNVISNLEGIAQVFAIDKRDRVLGIIPFSHSFGFTCTLWLPMSMGISAVYHADPADIRTIGRLVRKHRVTILLAAPTFLKKCAQEVPSRDFGSLVYVITGGERLPEDVSAAFEDKFGVRPFEGYGCTECAPVVAVNAPDYRGPGFYQVGHKRERIGHPLPGVSVRIVDPVSFEPLPAGEEGLLLVKGPNVMKGYMHDPELTDRVIRGGWYITGDTGELDEDGFLRITGRVSRVSKIRGETVPHGEVEKALHRMLDLADQSLAVVGIDDPEEGETLVVLHTLDDDYVENLISRLPESDLPETWRPHADSFRRIQAMPLLPSGKIDLARLKQFAESMY